MPNQDPVAVGLSLIGFAVFIILVVGAFQIAFSSLSQQQCKPYIDTIGQKDLEIGSLNARVNETTNLYNQCVSTYNTLISENITKQDFVEIKGYYNLTQIQITNLDQKFEQFSQNYISIYNTIINRYTISLGLNIAFGIEILSFAFLKGELIMYGLTWIRRRRTQNTQINQSVHINHGNQ